MAGSQDRGAKDVALRVLGIDELRWQPGIADKEK